MKKLDEIMELMADEMADFKVSLLKLEGLSKELNEMSVPISTATLDKNLKEFLQNQEKANDKKDEVIRDIKMQLERARLIPNYILVLLVSSLIILLSLLEYYIYSTKTTENEKFKIYQTISESERESYTIYFSEKPGLKEEYCKWLEQSHK